MNEASARLKPTQARGAIGDPVAADSQPKHRQRPVAVPSVIEQIGRL